MVFVMRDEAGIGLVNFQYIFDGLFEVRSSVCSQEDGLLQDTRLLGFDWSNLALIRCFIEETDIDLT